MGRLLQTVGKGLPGLCIAITLYEVAKAVKDFVQNREKN